MSIDATASIHPSAVIEQGASIGKNVHIGPFCHVGPNVVLHDGVELISHVALAGHTTIGSGTQIFAHASIGSIPQDLKYNGEMVTLEIGQNNRIREYVSINPGTAGGGGVTKIGDGNLLMMGVHIGHDCTLGNNIVIANYSSLAGHVTVEDNVVIGGLAGIHQFCRIGRGAMIGGMAGAAADVIPRGMMVSDRAYLGGLNLVGMKRAGFSKDDINGLRAAFDKIFKSDVSVKDTLDDVAAQYPDNPLVAEVIDFIRVNSSRSLHRPKE